MGKHRHYSTFHIAGFSYWDGCMVFNQLEIGTQLRLVYEPDNKFDAYAIALYYREYKLGYVPRSDNHDFSKFLEMGHEGLFEVRINRISKHEHPEHQIGVIVYITSKETM